MDYIDKFKKQFALRSFFAVVSPVIITGVAWFACDYFMGLNSIITASISITIGLLSAVVSSLLLNSVATKPVEKLEEIISYTVHSEREGAAPELNNLPIARELIENLSRQIYELGSTNTKYITADNTQDQVNGIASGASYSNPEQQVLDAIPMPIIGMDSEHNVTLANTAAAKYLEKSINEIVGHHVYDSLNLSFQTDNGLEQWITECKSSAVTANKTWDRVRQPIAEDKFKQFDLIASFSSGSSSGTETMLAIFDRSEQYNLDDREVAFVAMAVHELRTPLTIMRGYIEVFEDELSEQLSPELVDFMHKMQASAQQLTAFVSNILNVARIDENQLILKLRSENWSEILTTAIDDLRLRATVHGKKIELSIADNLPPVAADRISLHEVINNLVDNAIKYSGKSENIIVSAALNSDGLIETSVQDFGIGIPSSVMSQLFQKFHRSHKSQVQVGGTGLGLFISKELVNAHGGNIWVRSKEGEGSSFNFTILPYDRVAKEQTSEQDGIVRGAHGWIKNHSLYRN